MQQIGDKAGVRLVLPFARDRKRVVEICGQVLLLTEPENVAERLGSERVGYLGLHHTAQIRPDALEPADSDLADLRAELQLHTKAESAWAVAAHDSLYKSVIEVPDAVARRLNRLAALAEIFDDQVERFLVELGELPGFVVLDTILPKLDALLLRFTPGAGDKGISALLIPPLAELYDVPLEGIVSDRIAPYVEAHDGELRELYERHEGDARANLLLYQPEALMLLERLDTDPYRLRGVWPGLLDVEPLERLATLRGKRLS
jgi:hypothetical protein